MKSRHLIATIALAAMSSITMLATAQPNNANAANHSWHLLPQVQPLLAYLRCEEVPLNQFGEAQKPTEELAFLAELLFASKPGLREKMEAGGNESPEQGDEFPLISLEVWPGLRAELHVLAGYGFFGVSQFYPAAANDGLLKAMAAAGWDLKRVPPGASASHAPELALVPVFEASKPMGKLVRTMTLTEARVDYLTNKIDLDGVTVGCAYTKGKE